MPRVDPGLHKTTVDARGYVGNPHSIYHALHTCLLQNVVLLRYFCTFIGLADFSLEL